MTSPSVAAKRVRDKDAKQRALLHAASEVFAKVEFERATTAEIARRAGCSESLIFRYFGDKQKLFEATLVRHLDEMTSAAEARVNAALPDRVEEYLAQLTLARRRMAPSSAAWSFFRRALADPEFSHRTYRPAHERRVALIVDGLRAYQERGQIRADIDVETVGEVLATTIGLGETLQPRLLGESAERREALASATIGIVMAGIAARSDDGVPGA